MVTVFVNNIQKQKLKRKLLRNNATPQEVVLWSRLRDSQLGFKFRRQASIGNFIADFYCPTRKLVVEVDGSQHIDSESDKERTKFLNTAGVYVLRFWNNEVDGNLDGVITKIITTLNPSFERREGEKT